MWNQVYNPFNNSVLSTVAAALPVVTLLVLIASNKVKAHIAAVIALVVANLVAIFIFTMPADMSLRASALGAVTGFFPIGWIVLNVIFLYQITVATGRFELLKRAVGGVTEDRAALDKALQGEEWQKLKKKLMNYVTNFNYKIVQHTGHFQL